MSKFQIPEFRGKFQGIETYSMFHKHIVCFKAFPGDTMIQNLPPMQERQEVWIRVLSQEDPLGEGMAPHSRILAWKIPRTEEPGGLQSTGSQRIKYDQATEHKITKISDIIQYFFAYFLHSFSDLSLKLSKAFFLF